MFYKIITRDKNPNEKILPIDQSKAWMKNKRYFNKSPAMAFWERWIQQLVVLGKLCDGWSVFLQFLHETQWRDEMIIGRDS